MNDLLNYVCISVPFELIVQYEGNDYYLDGMTSWNEVQLATMDYMSLNYTVPLSDIKPYLRPLSSMTEAENDDLYESGGRACWKNGSEIRLNELSGFKETYRSLIWLVRNHFDCFNLINQGLAIGVTKNNNPYEKDNCK
jgi:hypothetical protein